MVKGDTVLVAGAAGRVGRLVAIRLLLAGHAVRVIVRNAEKLTSLANLGAEVRAGALADRSFLATAFRGASAAFVISPIDLAAPDVNAEQMKNVESTAAAIRDSGLEHLVLLSSLGAELTERGGGIIGCHHFEKLLDGIPELNAVYLRAAWFMDHFLWNIPLIKIANVNGLAIKPDVSFPTVAAHDIARVAADYLSSRTFTGKTIRYLNGPRDYNMVEVTRILGSSIGRPDLRYVVFSAEAMRKGLVESGGLSPNAADLAVAVNLGINSGYIRAEQRSTANTTPTTLEAFAKTTFAHAFRAASALAVEPQS